MNITNNLLGDNSLWKVLPIVRDYEKKSVNSDLL